MPPLFQKEVRKIVKKGNVIPGQKSLHRGIHIHANEGHVKSFKANPNAKRNDHRDLLVHHQKINADLQDVFARTANLHKDNMTMEERIEEGWKAFERVGGRRPKKAQGYAKHLETVSKERKLERDHVLIEKTTSGETVDYGRDGSALHNVKDRRIKAHVARQLKRAHLLRRMGDPTPLKQSGKFDDRTATLNVFKKTMRQVGRQTAADEKFRTVKNHKSGKTMWDLRGGNENLNRPDKGVINFTTEFDLGRRRRNTNSGRGARRS